MTGLVVVAAGVIQSFDVADVPSPAYWHHGWHEVVYLCVISAAAILSFLVVVGYTVLLGRIDEREQLRVMADGLVSVVEKSTDLTRAQIGVHIYRVQGIVGFRRLERLARVAPSQVSDARVLWTKGKGVVGYAWNRGPKFVDLDQVRQDYPTEKVFCAVDRDSRFRFSWEEFEQTKEYKAVLAVPLAPKVNARYPVRGVLSVSAFESRHRTELESLPAVDAFLTIKNTCEQIIGQVTKQAP